MVMVGGCIEQGPLEFKDYETSANTAMVTIHAALDFEGPKHDVESIKVKLVSGTNCDATPIEEETIELASMPMPAWMDETKTVGDQHPFASAMFVLEPGEYSVCAVPLDKSKQPSKRCMSTWAPLTVVAGQTNEYVLVAQCLADPLGAAGAIVALNDPPVIDDIDVVAGDPDLCEPTSITVEASDANNDPMIYLYRTTDKPNGAAGQIVGTGDRVVFATDTVGKYALTVTVTDPYGAFTSLEFPVNVTKACLQ